tara:strand:- start:871 stop:1722 length:852 start_codon:yes stop_codon:yes gene_type:complete
MPAPVLPSSHVKKTIMLKEDDDQSDLDSIFFVSIFLYSIYVTLIPWIYNEKDAKSVDNFHLIISNFFGCFPIMQAQGLWLKSLLITTVYFSLVWHWSSDLQLDLPHDDNLYGKGDSILSIITIISYCLSWIPKFKVYQPTEEEEKKLWYKYFRGDPKQTAEWRCRFTLNLVVNIFVCCLFGILLYMTSNNENEQDIQITLCWAFIFIALVSGFYQLHKKSLEIGMKKKKHFVFWLCTGTLFGIMAFLQKIQNTIHSHIFWHMYVMGSAYSFSRAAEYLQINKN